MKKERDLSSRGGDLSSFIADIIQQHGWENLCEHPPAAHVSTVIDFYAKLGGQHVNNVEVQRCEVTFYKQAINIIYELREWREPKRNKIMDNPT